MKRENLSSMPGKNINNFYVWSQTLKLRNAMLWAKRIVTWGCWELSGLRFIYEKINPPPEKKPIDYKPPVTITLWIIATYIALFGVASSRYENRVDIIENRGNAIFAQLSTSTYKEALERIPRVQNMACPSEPNLLWPPSVFFSLFGEARYKPMVLLMKETVEDWSLNLEKTSLCGADLSEIRLTSCNLKGVDLSYADLSGADLSYADLSGADLSNANLIGAYLAEVDLIGARLVRADLSDAYLAGANLIGANFAYADLIGARLIGADLSGARLKSVDLSGADFTNAKLKDADLIGAKLIGADLSGANLKSVDLSGADFTNAKLKDADLIGAKLISADLSGANLKSVDLSGADFTNAKLKDADLTGSYFIVYLPIGITGITERESKPIKLDTVVPLPHNHHVFPVPEFPGGDEDWRH